MENNAKLTRRTLIQKSLLLSGAAASLLAAPKAIAAACGLTPPQTPGPFYPVKTHFDENNDLTKVLGKAGKSMGEVIYIQGKITDENCQPISYAVVEIWQADTNGKYDHPGDSLPQTPDPNFQHWGRTITNKEGEYWFKTIKPGAYPATPNWTRPPHIHCRVLRRGYDELITQLYFSDEEELNSKDKILMNIHVSERSRVITTLKEAGVGFESGSRVGSFDITMKKVR